MTRRATFAAFTAAALIAVGGLPAAAAPDGAAAFDGGGDWEVTSGDMSVLPGGQWWTDSPVFRLVTTDRYKYGDVAVTVGGTINEFRNSDQTPEVDWDGVHLFLRYKSQFSLYYASVARRDGKVVIKKKCEGGTSNGGTYYDLASGAVPRTVGTEFTATAGVEDTPEGPKVWLETGGERIEGIDTGVGCAQIASPGKVGIRADNVDLTVSHYAVEQVC